MFSNFAKVCHSFIGAVKCSVILYKFHFVKLPFFFQVGSLCACILGNKGVHVKLYEFRDGKRFIAHLIYCLQNFIIAFCFIINSFNMKLTFRRYSSDGSSPRSEHQPSSISPGSLRVTSGRPRRRSHRKAWDTHESQNGTLKRREENASTLRQRGKSEIFQIDIIATILLQILEMAGFVAFA